MGPLYPLLVKYNALRRPQTFYWNLGHETLEPLNLSKRVRPIGNLLLDICFKNETRFVFQFGAHPNIKNYIKLLSFIAPTLFLFTLPGQNKTSLFKKSFRRLKKYVGPFVNAETFKDTPSYTNFFTKVKGLPKFFFFCLSLDKFFLTKNSNFYLSLKAGRKISPGQQFLIYFARLLAYDFSFLRWGLYLYPRGSTLQHYKIVASFNLKTRRLSRFYADGVLDYLDEEDFPELHVTDLPSTNLVKAEPLTENYIPDQSLVARPGLYLEQQMFNKGRYARNRQTYRTGVLWCIWLTILTVMFPSYLWYGLVPKFTYLWPLLGFSFFGVSWIIYGKQRRWIMGKTFDLLIKIFNFFK